MSDEARHGPAGAAQAVVRASSEDRKPVSSGSPPPAAVAHKIQLKSADMKEEMRQEAFEIARVVRALRPRSRSAFFLGSIWFSSLRPC
jgi:dynein light chain LC8-type